MSKDTKKTLHTVYYSSAEMAQFFDNQYFNTERYKTVAPLDINTDLIRHSHDFSDVMKTLLHRMRNIAKQNKTIKECKEQRKPRIAFCGYSVTANDETPINFCSAKNGKFFFNGIANCGGYWRCPVCAVKISEAKKEFIAGLIAEHQNKGKRIGFLTLTIRHKRTDSLKKSLDLLTDNYTRFQRTRQYAKLKKAGKIIGQVKTLEITWSERNGWHPHLHLLYFYDNETENDANIELLQKRIISHWVTFRGNDALIKAQNQQILTKDISDYVAKYDICMEMTKGQIKGSKGLTPFTALAKLALNQYETIEERNKLYGLYCRYVEETFGKHFVNISNSLRKTYKDYFDEEKTDDEIVNEVEIDQILMKFCINAWKKVCKNDLQPLIINKYKENGIDAVYNLLIFFKDFKDVIVEIDKHDIPIFKIENYETKK